MRAGWAVRPAVIFPLLCCALERVWASRCTCAIPITRRKMAVSKDPIAASNRNVWPSIALPPESKLAA